jgi:tetratricopeptide (TPR) repeat protein
MMEDARIELALAHQKASRFAEAQILYRQVLTENTRHPTALNYYGVLAIQTGQLDLAVKLLQRATSANPRDASCHCNLGEALRQSSKAQAAMESFREAIRLNPQLAVAHNNLGILLAAQGEYAQAIDSYRRAVQIQPTYAEAHGNLGNALKESRQFDQAIAECRIAVSLKPQSAECHNQLAAALAQTGENDEAIAEYRAAIQIDPGHADAHSNMGNALAAQGRVRDAIASCETAVQIRPDSIPAHWNFAVALLRAGDYQRGWLEHEWRLRSIGTSGRSRFSQKAWDGDPLNGKTILLHAEQGFGDTIQFARYVPFVVMRGGRVIVECHPELARLFRGIEGINRVIANGDTLPHFNEQISLMSLPLIFQTRLETIPASIPYLKADEALIGQWNDRLRAVAGGERLLHVGLCGSGNPGHRNDRERSIPLASFSALATDGVVFHSLHNAPVEFIPDGLYVVDHANELTDFAETAALVANLHHVVTVDTAVAHLSGALGIPTSVLLPSVPDWRWMMHRQDNPWYPTVRLYRQKRPGEWTEVMQRVGRAIREMASSSAARGIEPVSQPV